MKRALAAGLGPAAIAIGVPLTILAGGIMVDTLPASNVTADNVPAQYAAAVNKAGQQCTAVTAPIIAAQLDAESSWNPRTTSPAGAQGLAQFMPGTWAAWGKDVDGNGTASPFDPLDAIDAQGRFMCHLADAMQRSSKAGSVSGTVLDLALASYNAGPGAVLRYRGIPPYPETRNYVTKIKALAGSQYTSAQPTGQGGGPVPPSFNQQGNPRTVEQAIADLEAHIPNGYPGKGNEVQGHCERYMNLAYGLGAGYATAVSHWFGPGPTYTGPAPRGAVVFIASPNEAEHVALSIGNGLAISTDFSGGRYAAGKVGVGTVEQIAKAMGGPVRGWREPNFSPGSEVT